ncbi:platelet glycoprotein IX [Dryobates pubescens]|uniref:platelet glycoprotein IX n=1 Tax=Dryobates pubescens TaxID=118200 RepID=UPI0023B93BED|nr:platelet glycoprotein IX [Dryobates pubescens]
MKKTELTALVGFPVSLLLAVALSGACPPSCSCKTLGDRKGLQVDCGSRGLREVPALPVDTRRLYLQNNSLTTVPPGSLDSLSSLEELEVFDNPWNCDCGILYLKLWLEDVSAPSLASVRCASPAPVSTKPLVQLTGNELGACKRLLPIKCVEFFWRDLILIAGAIITLLLVAWALKFSKKLLCQIRLSRYYDSGGYLLGRPSSKTYKIQ